MPKLAEQSRSCDYCGTTFTPVTALQTFCSSGGPSSCKRQFERKAFHLGRAALRELLRVEREDAKDVVQ